MEAFRKGLGEVGYTAGRNVTVEYNYLDGRYDHLPALLSDLVRRQVALIATPASSPAAVAAKAATSTIPIVFAIPSDPVKLGLVSSLARPGGNATGVNYLANETTSKRLRLLHDLLPKATRIAVLVNPANPQATGVSLQAIKDSAGSLGFQIDIFNAGTAAEIDLAFATITRESHDAVFVGPDGFLNSRRDQLVSLAMAAKMPESFDDRGDVAAGGLMSYGTDLADVYNQVGVYSGSILRGDNPRDLPVVQSTKFVFAINMRTAHALGIEVRPDLLAIADEVIE